MNGNFVANVDLRNNKADCRKIDDDDDSITEQHECIGEYNCEKGSRHKEVLLLVQCFKGKG